MLSLLNVDVIREDGHIKECLINDFCSDTGQRRVAKRTVSLVRPRRSGRERFFKVTDKKTTVT